MSKFVVACAARVAFLFGIGIADRVLAESLDVGLRVGGHQLRTRSGLRMHEDERQFSGKFSAKCAEEQFDFDGVRNDDSESVALVR